MSAIQRWEELYKKFNYCGLKSDENNFKVAKMHFQQMILKKKKSYFEGRTRSDEQTKITLEDLEVTAIKSFFIQFKALENENTFKRFYSELAGGLQEKLSKVPSKFSSQITKN